MRLASLCLEQAIILTSDTDIFDGEKANSQLEDEIRNLLLESQRSLAIAANIVGVLSHASYFVKKEYLARFYSGSQMGSVQAVPAFPS